jgi:guanylate kinase
LRIFISGPSGVGKSTIIQEILKRHPDILLSISYTTRPPRPGERDGKEYFFVACETFETMVKADRFLEWALVHGQRYGTPLDWVSSMEDQGHHILFDIDVQGVRQAKAKGSQGCFIMLLPPTLEELARRLAGRGTEDPQALATRLENAKKEMRAWSMYDYLVVNDRLEKAIAAVEIILDAYSYSKEEAVGRLKWLSRIG